MPEPVPDVKGYLLPEACRLLQQSGYQVTLVTTGGPTSYRSRVLKQRQLDERSIELTRGFEIYKDPSIDEKEVRDNALQDH